MVICNSIISCTIISWHSSLRSRCPLLPCPPQHRFLDYFIVWARIHYYHYLFRCSNCPRFRQWDLLQASSCFFFKFSSIFEQFPFSIGRCLRLILYFPCPNPEIIHFSKKLCSFSFFRMVFRNQNLDVRVLIATGVSLLLGPFSKQS